MPPLYRIVWLWLLMRVDYKNGSMNTSMSRIGQGVSWIERDIEHTPNRRTISKILDYLQEQNMITHESNRLFTSVSISNWDIYNSQETMKVTVKAQPNAQPNTQPNAHHSRSTHEKLKEVDQNLSPDGDLFGVSKPEPEEPDQATNPNVFLKWVSETYVKVPLTSYKRLLVPVKELLTDRLRSNTDPQAEVQAQFKKFMAGAIDSAFTMGDKPHTVSTFIYHYANLLELGNGKASPKSPLVCPEHGRMERANVAGKIVYFCKQHKAGCQHTYRSEITWTDKLQTWEMARTL